MATTKCQLRSQVRELRAYAEALLAGNLQLSDGERSYLANVVYFTDEFLSEVAASPRPTITLTVTKVKTE